MGCPIPLLKNKKRDLSIRASNYVPESSSIKIFPPSHAAKLEGDTVEFYLTAPNYWEGYRKREINGPFLQFQMRRTDSNQYIVEYFNTNQHAIAIPLNELQDVISVLDVSIKLGVKYKNP